MTNEQMAARLQNLARGIEVIAKIGPAYGEDNENDLAALCAGAKALCEVDQMRAERDAAQAEAAGLREALALTNNCGALDDPMWTAWKEANSDALARTSDQHRARIEAARLREAEVRG